MPIKHYVLQYVWGKTAISAYFQTKSFKSNYWKLNVH